MEKTESIVQACPPGARDSRKFDVQCSAGKIGSFHAGAESLAIQVGQRVLREGAQQIWHSVTIFACEDEFGSLVIRVLVFNPDWEEPLQIASITSRPYDPNCRTTLDCNLNHITA